MNTVFWKAASALMFCLSISGASAQQSQNVRIRGAIENVAGNLLAIKTRDGQTINVNLSGTARVFALVKASMEDIKPNSYIGVSAMPQPDGSQRAMHVHIFPEALRGVAEGFGPWDVQPGSTMTNATVMDTVAGVDGQTINVKYKDGEKKIIVPKDAPIVTYVPGDKAELKAGAKIFVIAAVPQADGTFNVARVNVGRGITPPM